MYFFGVFVRVSNFLSVARTPAPQNHTPTIFEKGDSLDGRFDSSR